jgi:hypothetical protein
MPFSAWARAIGVLTASMITAERIDTSFTRIILELGDSSDVLSEEQEAAANDWILRARNDESTPGVLFGLF